MQNIIEVRDLVKRFGDNTAVNAISFTVNEGEIFGLLGPNGAGKTTTIKVLTTLLLPTSGQALVAGYDVGKKPMEVRRLIGYVPQAISADGTLTGYENLMVFAKLYDVPRAEQHARVSDALAFMGLQEAGNRLVRTYSGGMIRRLEVAQAVLHRPEVLFLDEPTVGLDPVARKAVWEHLAQLRERFNMTMLITTHYMEEADSLCQRVAIMHLGNIMAMDTPEALKVSVGGPETSLDDVFTYFTGNTLETGGTFRDTARTRRAAGRLS
jgi:ABC-2 type transport system ATP-binding protein